METNITYKCNLVTRDANPIQSMAIIDYRLSYFLPIGLSIGLSDFLSIGLSIGLSNILSIGLSIGLLSMSFHQFFRLLAIYLLIKINKKYIVVE